MIHASPLPKPNFLILGAQKAGTNSLCGALKGHPEVWIEPGEPHYFTVNYIRGERWYAELMAKGRTARAWGDCTPYYLLHPLAPERAFRFNPSLRLLVLVRHPVNRTVSHYYHSKRHGQDSLGLEQALAAEPIRLRGETERLRRDGLARSFAHVQHSYVARSLYLQQIERWLEFFPREQIFVVATEELRTDPETWLRRCWEFLGLDPNGGDVGFPGLNVNPMRKKTFDRGPLLERFREPNEAFFEWWGRRLDWDS